MQMWIEYFIKIKYKNIKEMPKIYYILVPNIFTYFETYQFFGHFLNLKKYIYVCVYKQFYIYIYICLQIDFESFWKKIIIIYIYIF